jgi:protein phosphatase-4 regulatory subunit 3
MPQEYVKLMVDTLSQAEDLESIPDLHALCNLMQTISMWIRIGFGLVLI